jgi:transposase-like protein
MPKQKYSPELKSQVLTEYEESGDAKAVAKKHGIEPKQVWQWKAVAKAKPKRDGEAAFRKLKRENAELQQENALLREIVKKTAMVMPIN